MVNMYEINKDDEVKKIILEAAKKAFQKWGLYKTTMEDIAKEAGKGKSTLYYYYKNKDEIFDLIVHDEMSAALAKTKKIIEKVDSAKEKLKFYIVTTLTELKKSLSLYNIIREEIKGNKKLLDKIKVQIQAEEELFIKNILIEGMRRKEFNFIDETELNKAAKVVYGIIMAMELYLFLDNDDLEQIDIAAKLIANGI